MSEPTVRRLELFISQSLIEDLLIDGFQFELALDEVDSWCRGLTATTRHLPGDFSVVSNDISRRVLSRRASVFHLTNISSAISSDLHAAIVNLHDATGLRTFSVSEVEAGRGVLDEVLALLPSELSLVIFPAGEESFSRIAANHSVSEPMLGLRLKELVKAGGWQERSLSYSNVTVGAALLEISAPSPEEFGLSANKGSGDSLVADSGMWIPDSLLESLPGDLTWVIKGKVPVGASRRLRQELELVRSLNHRFEPGRKLVNF